MKAENKRITRGGSGLVPAKIEFDISAHRQRHVVHGVNIPRMENEEDFLIWIPPLASHVPCRDKKGEGMRKRNSARGRRKLSEASRLNYLSRGPVFLDLLSLIRSPPWKRRKFHFVAQLGGNVRRVERRVTLREALLIGGCFCGEGIRAFS